MEAEEPTNNTNTTNNTTNTNTNNKKKRNRNTAFDYEYDGKNQRCCIRDIETAFFTRIDEVNVLCKREGCSFPKYKQNVDKGLSNVKSHLKVYHKEDWQKILFESVNKELQHLTTVPSTIAATLNYMDYSEAKKALSELCTRTGRAEEEEVKKIIDEHPSLINEVLDSYGNTVLLLAAAYNQMKIITLLLSYDNLDIEKRTKNGWTALHIASYHGYKEIAESLLSQNNIDINRQNNDGRTALHSASENGRKEIVEILLSHNDIDINKQCNDGRTALHYASSKDRRDIIKLLLSDHHIDVNKQDKNGNLASEICCHGLDNKSNIPMVLELFKNHSFGILLAKEKESLNQQILQGLEERMREITNDHMKEMENLIKTQEKKEYTELRDRMIRMENTFDVWIKQIESRIDKTGEMRSEEKKRSSALKPSAEISFDNNLLETSTTLSAVNRLSEVSYRKDDSGKNGKDSVTVQWYERLGFNERIGLACHEIGVDGEEDLHAVFADDELYEQLRRMLRPLDQKKVEAVRQKLSS